MSKDTQLAPVNIVLYVVLCVFTFGLFYFYWQLKQFEQCNALFNERKHGFLKWFLLSFITFGIFHFYHEYKLSQDIINLQRKYGLKEREDYYPIACLIISLMGFILGVDFIHQEDLNKIIEKYNQDNYF